MSQARYPRALIGLHWLTLLLIVVVYACMEFRGMFPRGSEPRDLMKAIHFSAGLTVLVFVLVRILMRLSASIPPVTPPLPALQKLAAAAGHLALYGFMIGMPLMGWLLLSAEGASISLWGVPLPALVGVDQGLAHTLEDLHETGATVGYALIGLHALAALYHHHIRRDDTLRRMWPGARG
jgi:cytochrome b561